MQNVPLLNRTANFSTILAELESDSQISWLNMHGQAKPMQRPCFSEAMLDDLLMAQNRVDDLAQLSSAPQLMVLSSAVDVFNLGGDLALFSQLIRKQDRATLERYAEKCIQVAAGFFRPSRSNVHTIALVQGDALGGGFEAALCCQTVIAESGVSMGFPEVLFDLFPGMGAYPFLRRRMAPALVERMMLDARSYTSDELHKMGVIDIIVPRGEGREAVRQFSRTIRRAPGAHNAMNLLRAKCEPVPMFELQQSIQIWVDSALNLSDRALSTIDRLVRAQNRRGVEQLHEPEISQRLKLA
jgi:DSF synthase